MKKENAMNNYLKVAVIHLSSNLYRDQQEFDYSQSKLFEVTVPAGLTTTTGKERMRFVEIAYRPTAKKHIDCFRTMVDLAKEESYDALLVNPADALIYDTHPEIALPGAWTKLELGNELDHARDLGLEVFPMLNFSAAHDVWMGKYAYMVSTPDYYKLCEDLIDELCVLFEQPRYFHLGLDGENADVQMDLDYAVVRGDQLFIHDMHFLMAACRKHKATPWISADLAIESLHLFEEAVPKDVLLSQTQVKNHALLELWPSEKAFVDAAALGYTTMMPTLSSYVDSSVPTEALSICQKHLPQGAVFGFVADPYLACEDDNRYKLMYEIAHSMRAFKNYLKGIGEQ